MVPTTHTVFSEGTLAPGFRNMHPIGVGDVSPSPGSGEDSSFGIVWVLEGDYTMGFLVETPLWGLMTGDRLLRMTQNLMLSILLVHTPLCVSSTDEVTDFGLSSGGDEVQKRELRPVYQRQQTTNTRRLRREAGHEVREQA